MQRINNSLTKRAARLFARERERDDDDRAPRYCTKLVFGEHASGWFQLDRLSSLAFPPGIEVPTISFFALARRAFKFADVGDVLQQRCGLTARLGLGVVALLAQRRQQAGIGRHEARIRSAQSGYLLFLRVDHALLVRQRRRHLLLLATQLLLHGDQPADKIRVCVTRVGIETWTRKKEEFTENYSAPRRRCIILRNDLYSSVKLTQ